MWVYCIFLCFCREMQSLFCLISYLWGLFLIAITNLFLESCVEKRYKIDLRKRVQPKKCPWHFFATFFAKCLGKTVFWKMSWCSDFSENFLFLFLFLFFMFFWICLLASGCQVIDKHVTCVLHICLCQYFVFLSEYNTKR